MLGRDRDPGINDEIQQDVPYVEFFAVEPRHGLPGRPGNDGEEDAWPRVAC
jgi:hypothetical protein